MKLAFNRTAATQPAPPRHRPAACNRAHAAKRRNRPANGGLNTQGKSVARGRRTITGGTGQAVPAAAPASADGHQIPVVIQEHHERLTDRPYGSPDVADQVCGRRPGRRGHPKPAKGRCDITGYKVQVCKWAPDAPDTGTSADFTGLHRKRTDGGHEYGAQSLVNIRTVTAEGHGVLAEVLSSGWGGLQENSPGIQCRPRPGPYPPAGTGGSAYSQ